MSQLQSDYSVAFAGVPSDSLAWREFMLEMYNNCIPLLETALERNKARRDKLEQEIKELKERQNNG